MTGRDELLLVLIVFGGIVAGCAITLITERRARR